MVLISKAWSNREKTIGTALALLAVVPFLTLAIVDSYTGARRPHSKRSSSSSG
jgi:hypothetical protein